MLYNLRFFFSSKCRLFHNATLFGFCITHILNTGCAKIWKKKSVAKRLITVYDFLIFLSSITWRILVVTSVVMFGRYKHIYQLCLKHNCAYVIRSHLHLSTHKTSYTTLFLTVYRSDRLFCYIQPTYLFFDCSYINWKNSCMWIFGILLKYRQNLKIILVTQYHFLPQWN